MTKEAPDSLQAHLLELRALEEKAREELQEACEQMQAGQPGLLGKYLAVHLGGSCVFYTWQAVASRAHRPQQQSQLRFQLSVTVGGGAIWTAFSCSIKMDL